MATVMVQRNYDLYQTLFKSISLFLAIYMYGKINTKASVRFLFSFIENKHENLKILRIKNLSNYYQTVIKDQNIKHLLNIDD